MIQKVKIHRKDPSEIRSRIVPVRFSDGEFNELIFRMASADYNKVGTFIRFLTTQKSPALSSVEFRETISSLSQTHIAVRKISRALDHNLSRRELVVCLDYLRAEVTSLNRNLSKLVSMVR